MEHWSGLYVLSANEVGSYITSEGRENRCQLLLFPRPVRESVPPVEIEIFGPRVSIRFFFFSFFFQFWSCFLFCFVFFCCSRAPFVSFHSADGSSRLKWVTCTLYFENAKKNKTKNGADRVPTGILCWISLSVGQRGAILGRVIRKGKAVIQQLYRSVEDEQNEVQWFFRRLWRWFYGHLRLFLCLFFFALRPDVH